MSTSKVTFMNRHRGKSVSELNQVKSALHGDKSKNGNKAVLLEAVDELLLELKQKSFRKNYEGDAHIALTYVNKIENAKSCGHRFSLTLAEWRRLITRKRCAYTGALLLDDVPVNHPNKRTIDRIDASKGYITGNVAAVTFAANQLKSVVFESPNSPARMDAKMLAKFAKAMLEHAN